MIAVGLVQNAAVQARRARTVIATRRVRTSIYQPRRTAMSCPIFDRSADEVGLNGSARHIRTWRPSDVVTGGDRSSFRAGVQAVTSCRARHH